MPVADLIMLPFVYPAALLLKSIRRAGVYRMPLCRKVLMKVGVFPIINHYYEPLFDVQQIKHSLSDKRDLPGIEWNIKGQLEILDSFRFNDELNNVPLSQINELTFYLNSGTFFPGDAEYWYSIIRLKKPKIIFEIGSGNSTLMAIKAIKKNKEEEADYKCRHVCIEPYEMQWLEKTEVSVIRQKVEDVGTAFFSELNENDILFIDSSHIIRPQGDVLFEYLELLPVLNKGVIVHIHDILSPQDYPEDWVKKEVRFWNEQYLLEAFLTSNRDWKIIGALNFLHHHFYDKLKEKCFYLTSDRKPVSFYIQKVA